MCTDYKNERGNEMSEVSGEFPDDLTEEVMEPLLTMGKWQELNPQVRGQNLKMSVYLR